MCIPGGKRKRGKPTDCTLPGDPKKTKEAEEACPICDVTIQGGDTSDQAVYCDGNCQG